MLRLRTSLILVMGFYAFTASLSQAAAPKRVSIVADVAPGPPVRHGLGKLTAALAQKGLLCEQQSSLNRVRGEAVVIAGLASGGGAAAQMLKALNLAPPGWIGSAYREGHRVEREAGGAGDRL